MNLIINKYLVDAVLTGKKTACMTQGNFILGDLINLQFHPGKTNELLTFAQARIYYGTGLKIDPPNKNIFIYKGKEIGFVALNQKQTAEVIKAEGILHQDQFWAAHSEPLEVFQIYFNELKILKIK